MANPELFYTNIGSDTHGDSDHDVDMLDQPQPPPVPPRKHHYVSDISNDAATRFPELGDFAASPSNPGASGSLASTGSNLAGPLIDTVETPNTTFVTVTHGIGFRRIHTENGERDAQNRPQDRQGQLETSIPSRPHYQQANLELQGDASIRKDYETKLAEKDAQLIEIQAKAKNDLEKKDKELKEALKNWKKVGGQLNKINLRASLQTTSQLTDQYLIDKVESLGFSIRNFAIQHFDGEPIHALRFKNPDFIDAFVLPTDKLRSVEDDLFKSAKWCSPLIQGTVWRWICGVVFGKFLWAPGCSIAMSEIKMVLSHTDSAEDLPSLEEERKIQAWIATTATLLSKKLDLNEGSEAFAKLDEQKRSKVTDFYEALKSCVRVDKGLRKTLFEIVGDAIALDMEMSTQAAKVTWMFGDGDFDPSTMIWLEADKTEPEKRDIPLLVAPGLKKRGKSNGEDFKVENLLLHTKMSYVPVKSGKPGGKR